MHPYSSVYDLLVNVAKAGKTTTYAEIGQLMGLDGNDCRDQDEIDRVLGDIACQEIAEGRPLLPAVALLTGTGYPKYSLFTLARELETCTYYDSRTFYASELKRVHEYWGK